MGSNKESSLSGFEMSLVCPLEGTFGLSGRNNEVNL